MHVPRVIRLCLAVALGAAAAAASSEAPAGLGASCGPCRGTRSGEKGVNFLIASVGAQAEGRGIRSLRRIETITEHLSTDYFLAPQGGEEEGLASTRSMRPLVRAKRKRRPRLGERFAPECPVAESRDSGEYFVQRAERLEAQRLRGGGEEEVDVGTLYVKTSLYADMAF
eukprot:CAMPEP_0173422936 /NCGR_PEP_ID=MMETSP1357-20121228/3446_1 /TAXON_ID=77926 /ORGANISM="Hemiselmis rufescens, Strain PCC563" /LENGTH=169 /DNA_ID=CAMNT_0014386003 /DNA_START=35 /DNA_END=544 /DNA_ORIENTATION=-